MTWILLGLAALVFVAVALIDRAIYRHHPELRPEPEPEPTVVEYHYWW